MRDEQPNKMNELQARTANQNQFQQCLQIIFSQVLLKLNINRNKTHQFHSIQSFLIMVNIMFIFPLNHQVHAWQQNQITAIQYYYLKQNYGGLSLIEIFQPAFICILASYLFALANTAHQMSIKMPFELDLDMPVPFYFETLLKLQKLIYLACKIWTVNNLQGFEYN